MTQLDLIQDFLSLSHFKIMTSIPVC